LGGSVVAFDDGVSEANKSEVRDEEGSRDECRRQEGNENEASDQGRSRKLRGRKEKTSGGLTTDMLMINKRGKIVSKRASANGKRRYKQIEDWTEAVMGARDILHVRGFLAINGKSLQGRALYMKAQMLREKARRALCTGPAPSPTALAEHPSLSSSGPACVATSPALEGCISGCMPMGSGVPQGSPATLLH